MQYTILKFYTLGDSIPAQLKGFHLSHAEIKTQFDQLSINTCIFSRYKFPKASYHVVFKCCTVIHLLPAASTVISSPSPGRTSHRYLNASHRKICRLTSSPWPSPSNTNLVWHDFKGTEKNLYFGHKQKPSCRKTGEAKGALGHNSLHCDGATKAQGTSVQMSMKALHYLLYFGHHQKLF